MNRENVLLFIFFFTFLGLCQDPQPIKYWRSGFEIGFPGEWLDYDNGTWTQSGTPNPGTNEAWTVVDGDSVPGGASEGKNVYKGWILRAQSESHRAYPCIHVDFASPLVNSWWVYLVTDYRNFPSGGWHHFATWGNNPDWDVHTMSVLGSGKLEMAHVSDLEIIGDNTMPLRRWVRFTVYLEYAPAGNNIIYCWMNGKPCMKATNIKPGGSNLQRAHWGMYASGNLPEGVQYNDDIQIWGLTGPWTDFTRVPPSPYDANSIGKISCVARPAPLPGSLRCIVVPLNASRQAGFSAGGTFFDIRGRYVEADRVYRSSVAGVYIEKPPARAQ